MTGGDQRSDAGFTLVEVLVVLSVIALMSGLMLAMMGQFRHLTAADRQLTRQAALQKSADHIAALLEQAEALPLDVTPNAPVHFMQATESSVRFLAVARGGAFAFGLSEISISMEEQNGVMRPVQASLPRRFGAVQQSPSKAGLSEEAAALHFSFLERAALPDAEPQWRPDWQSPAAFPLAVKVLIDSKSGRGPAMQASAIAYLQR
jgi:prepilin-type N-terminal cleavage/methylation domain-containing protein